MKPQWTPTGSLLYARNGLSVAAETADEWHDIQVVAGEGSDVVKSVLQRIDKDVSPTS